MNWLSRILRRPDPDYGYDDLYAMPIERIGTVADAADDLAPRFSTSASSIDHRREPGRDHDRHRAMRRAFVPSQPVQNAQLFAGRSSELRRIIRAIQDQHMHVVLYGDRGIGKTSLMHVVRELAIKADYVVSYTSCGEDTDFYDTFRSIAGRIPLLYDSELDPTIDKVASGGSLADRLPAGTLTVAQFSDLLANVAGTRVLIMLDEFDRTRSDRFRNNIAELIKNLSDRSIRVQLMIAGVASNLTDLIAHVPSIRRNIIGIGLPNMSDGEVHDLLDIATQSGEFSIAEDAADRLVAVSGGLPYLAALLGQHATLSAAESDLTQVTLDHVRQAVDLAREDIGSRLSPFAKHALARSGAMDGGSIIADAAAASVRNGGLINDESLLARLATLAEPADHLFEQVEGDPFGSLRFREDGVAAYVWLVQHQGV